jgi:hypothetical protein
MCCRRGFLDAKVAIFDAGHNTLTALTDPNASAGTSSYLNVYAGVVGDHAMWYAYATREQKEEREVWSAPLSGGSPRTLVTLTADKPTDAADAFSVTHGGVIWRLPTLAAGRKAGEVRPGQVGVDRAPA